MSFSPTDTQFNFTIFMTRPQSNLSIGPFTLAKTKIQKTWVFCCTVYTARKTHNIQGFWHEKRMREKPRISYWCFGKWCACATSLYLWPYTCSAHYVAGRGRVIPLKVMYCIRHYFRVQLFSRFWPGAVIREWLISRFSWCCHYYK